MATVLRLTRQGAKKRPYYAIVVADSRAPRDGRYIEQVGTYNPMLPREHADRVRLQTERVQHWLKTGAQPSDRLARVFAAAGLMKAPKLTNDPQKSAPKAKAQDRLKQAAEKAEAAKAAAEAAAAKPAPEPVVEAAPAAEALAEAAAETPAAE